MKKNFIFMLLVLAFYACQKNENPVVGQKDAESICFTAYADRALTRAVVSDVTTANLDTFRVACYKAGSQQNYFVNEQKATKDGAVFKTADHYFWPASTQDLDFFAYRGNVPSGVNNVSGTASIAYTVLKSADEDLIVAKNTGLSKTDAVSLVFNHVLSKVNKLTLAPVTSSVSATAKYKYKYTDVKITGAKETGTYSYTGSSADSWSGLSGSQVYSFTSNSGNFLGNATKELKTGSPEVNDQLVILPQTATFSVTYSVEYSADGTNWVEVLASTTKSTTIEMAKGYSYDITLHLPNSASEIIFGTVTVTDWTSGSADKTLE